jgi:hypothetical protein
MKPGFILIIATLLVCLSFGSALGGETKKLCPDPKFEYEVISGEEFWELFARSNITDNEGNITDNVQGDKNVCMRYSDLGEDFPYSVNLMVPKVEIDDSQKKEAGLIRGTTIIFRIYDYLLDTNHEGVLSVVYPKFSSNVEKITGLKFKTRQELFSWWKLNKDRLVLSQDGKHLVVKK